MNDQATSMYINTKFSGKSLFKKQAHNGEGYGTLIRKEKQKQTWDIYAHIV